MKKKLVLYQPVLRKWMNLGVQLERGCGGGGGGVGGSPVFFKNRIKNLIAILNAVLRIF